MWIRALLAMVIAVLALPGECAAQLVEEAKALRITRGHFESHAAALELTVAQHAAAETMFAAYEVEFDDAAHAANDVVSWLWTNTNSMDWYGGECTEAFGDEVSLEAITLEWQWQRGARDLENRYFDHLGQVAIGQDEQIEALRRACVRERLLSPERLVEPAGASADLIQMVEQFDDGLASRAEVKAVLAEYELALDRRLREYDDWEITRQRRVRQTLDAVRLAERTGGDVAAARDARADVYVGWWQHGNAIWRLHIDFAARIAALLPPEQKPAFDDVTCTTLHRYLRPDNGSTPEEAFDTALRKTDLDADRRARVEALREKWRSQRVSMMPTVTAAYLRTCDPVETREAWRLIFSGRREEVTERSKACERDWQTARQAWLAACERESAALDAIMAESNGEGTP